MDRVSVDEALAVIERLIAVALEDHPGADEFLTRPLWLPELLVARTLLDHLVGQAESLRSDSSPILRHCRTVPIGVTESQRE